MEAKELRFGNFVHNPVQKINLKVDLRVINEIIVDEKINREESLRFQPIPLTEEWLVKFGFIKHKYQNKDSIVDFIDKKTGWFTLAEKDGFFCLCEYRDLIGKQFRFVHQLQNLYFALTGEELTINQ